MVGVGEAGHTESPSHRRRHPSAPHGGQSVEEALPEGLGEDAGTGQLLVLLAPPATVRVPTAGRCDPEPEAGRPGVARHTLPRYWPRAGPVWPPSLKPGGGGVLSLASPSAGHGVALLPAPDSTPFIPLLTGWFPCSLLGSDSPAHRSVPLLTAWLPLVLVFPLAPIRPPHLAYGQQHLSAAPARLSS